MAAPEVNENCHHVQNDPRKRKIKLEKCHVDISWFYVSVNSKPDHPPATLGDSHILVAPGVGFSLFCLARGSVLGVCPGGS